MTNLLNDDQVERDLRRFFDWQAGQLDGAPSVHRATARIADHLRAGVGPWRTGRFVWGIVILGLLVCLVVGGALVGGLGQRPAVVIEPSPPVRSGSPTASAEALPLALQKTWVGAPKLIPRFSDVPEFGLLHIVDNSMLLFRGGGSQPLLRSAVTITGSTTLELVLDTPLYECQPGAIGRYAWSQSADGAQLTLSASSDACALRAAASTGTWLRSDCRNTFDTCLGPLSAGSFASTFLDVRDSSANVPPLGTYGQLRYSVPSGWANRDDWPTNFSLMPALDYAGPAGDPNVAAAHGIYIFARPAAATASDCTARLAPAIPQTPVALATWLAGRSDLVTTPPVPIAIDGNAGVVVDIRLAPEYGTVCPGETQPSLPILMDAGGLAENWSLSIAAGEQERVILISIDAARTVAIVIDDNSIPSRFGPLVSQAMPIVTTFAFPGQ